VEAAAERAAKPTGDEAEKPRRARFDVSPFAFKPGKSGNPAGARSLRDQADVMFETMSADLGPLTKTDEILLKQACLMLAKASRIPGRDRQNVDVAVRLHSEARRTITSLQRRAPKPSPGPLADLHRLDIEERRAEAAAVGEHPGDASEALDGSGEAQGASGRQTTKLLPRAAQRAGRRHEHHPRRDQG
jgi:hypothetical protein